MRLRLQGAWPSLAGSHLLIHHVKLSGAEQKHAQGHTGLAEPVIDVWLIDWETEQNQDNCFSPCQSSLFVKHHPVTCGNAHRSPFSVSSPL